jgi:hypothetical protein
MYKRKRGQIKEWKAVHLDEKLKKDVTAIGLISFEEIDGDFYEEALKKENEKLYKRSETVVDEGVEEEEPIVDSTLKTEKPKKKQRKKDITKKKNEGFKSDQKNSSNIKATPKILEFPKRALWSENISWAGTELHPLLEKSISELGFQEPTEIQRLTFQAALRDGKDIIGAAETVHKYQATYC